MVNKIKSENFIYLALALIISAVAMIGFYNIDNSPAENDGLGNYRIAYNVASKHSFSAENDGLKPTMFREPVPIAALSAWLAVNFSDIEKASPDVANGSTYFAKIKRINIIWSSLLIVFCFLSATKLTRNKYFGLISALAVAMTFIYAPWQVNNLNTDLAASAILMACIYFSIRLIERQNWVNSILFGSSLGILALTKAITLYASVVFMPLTIALIVIKNRNSANFLKTSVIMIIAFLAVIGPWIGRNYHLFDAPSIALRGGRVLNFRSLLNEMPSETYRASFYYWSPSRIKPVLEDITGYSREDADREGKGVAAPLNRGRSSFAASDKAAEKAGKPEDAISLLSQMRAENTRLVRKFKAEKSRDPTGQAQSVLQKQAIERIKANPLNHAITIAPVYWHMMWLRTVPVWISPFITSSIFVSLALGLYYRNKRIIAFSALPVGIMSLYLLTSHGLPRYSEPIVPAMIILFITVIAAAIPELRKKLMLRSNL